METRINYWFVLIGLLGLYGFYPFQNLQGQAIFSADTKHHCIYKGSDLDSELYLLANDPQIDRIIDEICESVGINKDFIVLHATVSSVAAVETEGQYYLLYSKYYCSQLLNKNPYLLYAILAHEIGHIVRKHQLDGVFRINEESKADEWMGRALYKAKNINSLESILPAIKQEKFTYEMHFQNNLREKIIRGGYKSEDGLARSNGNLGYFENKTNIDQTSLPVFELRGCPQFQGLPIELFLKTTVLELRQVNEHLSAALNEMGYRQQRYYSVPNGFALLTPVEQITSDGIAIQGQGRWQDYPSVGAFHGVLDYLKAIVVPRSGYFRLFVFVVTNKGVKNQGGHVDRKQARDWLEEGGFWLPEPIAKLPFTKKDYHIGVFLYEFQSSQSTKKLEARCNPNFLPIHSHLLQSGIMDALNKR